MVTAACGQAVMWGVVCAVAGAPVYDTFKTYQHPYHNFQRAAWSGPLVQFEPSATDVSNRVNAVAFCAAKGARLAFKDEICDDFRGLRVLEGQPVLGGDRWTPVMDGECDASVCESNNGWVKIGSANPDQLCFDKEAAGNPGVTSKPYLWCRFHNKCECRGLPCLLCGVSPLHLYLSARLLSAFGVPSGCCCVFQ